MVSPVQKKAAVEMVVCRGCANAAVLAARWD
jgi:hypothetical protein